MSKRPHRLAAAAAFAPPPHPKDPPRAARPTHLEEPETRMILAAVALHGMLAGKSSLPIPAEAATQDERRLEAATRLSRDAVALADALITELSEPR